MVALLLPLLAVGCATVAPSRIEGVQWPPVGGDSARVRLEQIISGPDGLGIARPWYSRLWRALAGEGEADRFVEPFAVALRGDRLAVGDTAAGTVWVFDRSDMSFVTVRSIGGRPVELPVGVALADDGVWISDSGTNRIDLVSFDGDTLRSIVPVSRPAGVALSADGVLAVAQPVSQTVALYYPDGTATTVGGSRAEGGNFNFPTQVAFAPDGSLLVSDSLNFRIQTFDARHRFVSAFGQRGDSSGFFARPRGVAVDAAHRVYVVDALFDAVQIFEPDGKLLLVVGQGGGAPGEFWLPAGIAHDRGRLAVADASNGRVQLFEIVQEEVSP